MTRAASFLAALVVVLFAVPALAGEVTVNVFTGPGAAVVQKQVTKAVCDEAQCVPAAKAKKAKKKPPVLNGKVVKAKKATNLDLWLVGANGKQAWKKTWPLAAGKLTPENLQKVTEQVLETVGGKTPPPPPPEPKPEPKPTPPPDTTSSSSSTSTSSSSSSSSTASATEAKSDGTKAELTEAKSEEPAATSSTAASTSSDSSSQLPTIFASVNIGLLSRGFTYDALTTANLHEYKGFPIAAPQIHLDAYPLARLTDGWLQGLGLEADFAFTLGLKAVSGSVDFPSQILRVNAALKFRIPVYRAIAVYPAVGFNYASFSLSPSKANTTLDGLPEVAYLGLKLGVGLDAPLLDDKLRLGLGVNYLPVFAAGEVISAGYFPEGSVWGLGVNASVGYRILSPLEVRLGFGLERYALSFKSIPSDTYRASGASDLLWSLSLGLGVVW
ncbi:MAG: hypothetical protein QM765_31705 [Myxococcales bacterium]